MEGRQVITEVDAEGCPSAPEAASTKFIKEDRVEQDLPIIVRVFA